VALTALLIAAGCGSGGGRPKAAPVSSPASGNSLNAILARPGEDDALVLGTGDFQIGTVRMSFLFVKKNGQPVYRPTAHIWVGRSLDSAPFEQTTAHLEDIGVPGKSAAALGGVTHLYVTYFRAPRPGNYFVVAQPAGAQLQGIAELAVAEHSRSPELGSKAPASDNPTIASTHGDFAALTTATPPDRGLLRYSIADSLRRHIPFVVVFATPKFCTSRTCGPVVDVADAVRKQFAGTRIRFIHVEVYKDNDPAKGFNRWFRQWRLPTEPWTFLVGADGRIKAKFEGSVGRQELASAVTRYLR
jgi:hypothetical protein